MILSTFRILVSLKDEAKGFSLSSTRGCYKLKYTELRCVHTKKPTFYKLEIQKLPVVGLPQILSKKIDFLVACLFYK